MRRLAELSNEPKHPEVAEVAEEAEEEAAVVVVGLLRRPSLLRHLWRLRPAVHAAPHGQAAR